jgi:NAD+ synthase (glutamine-hydrolysing)
VKPLIAKNEEPKLNRIRLAAAALNQTPLDWESNARHIRATLAAARDVGAAVLCLPELCITGYGCEDMFFSSGVQQTALEMVAQLVPETTGLVVGFGLPVFFEGGVYNAVAMSCDGRLLGLVAKQNLAGEGIHYEPRWFRPWPAGSVGTIDVDGQPQPIGDLLLDCGGVRIGLEICRDAWVAQRTGAQLAQRGADILLNPSASHFAFAKQHIRERFVLEGSRAFCVSYAYANLLGNEAGRSIYDGGTLIASGGHMLALGPRFSFADWVLTTAVIDVDSTRRLRAQSFAERPPCPAGGDLVSADFSFPQVAEPAGHVSEHSGTCAGEAVSRQPSAVSHLAPGSAGGSAGGTGFASASCQPALAGPVAPKSSIAVPGCPEWEAGPYEKEEEFARAVPLALFDYLRKSRSQGYVVSLSGGADSSTVAVLIHLLVQLGGRELGLARLAAKLSHIRAIAGLPMAGDDDDPATFAKAGRLLVRHLLTCVYQSTRNSSATTLDAALIVSEATGAEFVEWNVDGLVDDYVRTVSAAVGRQLTWDEDDLALQNIQARARGPGAWLLANLRGALLLTTSNRSEAAVGYATMDGDTCGGLAPIAGIDKAFLLDWLRWMESTGPAGIGPLPELSVVNQQQPTAELRPPAACQTDEADLMPYRVLDGIERAAIRDKLLPADVWESVCPQFPEFDRRQVGQWVVRFFELWCRNQWKRERYAPTFHLDDENLDPKTWCRFPILNSGFERELGQLQARLRAIN